MQQHLTWRVVLVSTLLVGLVPAFVSASFAQTAATATVLGTVIDKTELALPGAEVELLNLETNASARQVTDQAGRYLFPAVSPGRYRVTVTMTGFRTTTMPDLNVAVNQSYRVDVALELGQITETVQVHATSAVELQTTDAQIGKVVPSEVMVRLPTLTRQSGELLGLQPAVNPGSGGFPSSGYRVAGGIDDQNTVTLDGIDISDNVVGGGGNVRTMVPVPVDSVEEFRVGVANPNATFGRSSGGQVMMIGRRGTNTLQGAVYEYHQNEGLNANSWENNRLEIKKPRLRDNRFGARLGGPIFRDKTFFFGHYGGRRFPNTANILRLVPSETLKQGTLRFRDTSGNIVSYNLTSAANCGPAGNQPCDPRGVGVSPTVRALWSLMPVGNDPSAPGTDGLNTVGFRATINIPQDEDNTLFRIDHNFGSNWRLNATFSDYTNTQTTGGQLDIRQGNARALSSSVRKDRAVIAGLTGQLKQNLLNTVHFGWVRDNGDFNVLSPSDVAKELALAGTNTSAGFIALMPALAQTGFLDAPMDVDTQRARFQATRARNIQFVDNLVWVKGSHTLHAGADIRSLPTVHIRADKVVGSLTSLTAVLDSDVSNFLRIPNTNRPPTCGAGITTNCLTLADVQNWNRLYAAALGLIDNVSILAVRDGSLNALPFGTQLVNDASIRTYSFYGQDTWRMSPSLTFNYGLTYGWQTAPNEKLGRQTLIVDSATKEVLTANKYLEAKRQAALNGQVFNPELAYLPVRDAGRDVFDTDWTNFGPRVALTWSPAGEGMLGGLFGDRQTVLRGGFGIVYDRTNTVQSVIIPMLGVGFAQTINVAQPSCTASGTPGPGCTAASPSPASSGFRVGVDGTIPLPTVPAVRSPVVPAAPFGELLSFQVDPDTKIGRSYTFDASWQRELTRDTMIEVAYVGRLGRHLPQAINFNSSPYFFKDAASGQTFAEAFDAVATALREGRAPSAQPWFENQLAGAAPAGTVTEFLASRLTTAFINGLVSSLFTTMDGFRVQLGRPPYNNRQALELFMRTYVGTSDYHGLLLSLRKRMSRGLTFDANYTLSRAVDDFIANQNSAGFYSNSYVTQVDRGPSLFDRTHAFTGSFVYDLPAGQGHRFGAGKWLDRAVGGWYVAGIFTAFSGLPLTATQSTQAWGGGSVFAQGTASIVTRDVATGISRGVAGSSGIGTTGDPRNRGTGLNLFDNPEAAFNSFRQILLSQDRTSGRRDPLRGLGFWNLDLSLGKSTRVTDRVKARISIDFFNIFNNVNFVTPALDLTRRAAFGVISSQFVPVNRSSGSRWIQLGARIEF